MLRQAFTTTLGDERMLVRRRGVAALTLENLEIGDLTSPAEIFFGSTVDRALKPYSQSYLKSIFSIGMEWGIAP
jgi:hypothetical protein